MLYQTVLCSLYLCHFHRNKQETLLSVQSMYTAFICYALHATEMCISPSVIMKTGILQHPCCFHFSLHFQQNLTCNNLQHSVYPFFFSLHIWIVYRKRKKKDHIIRHYISLMKDIFLLCCGYTFQELCCKNWDFCTLRANCYLHIFRPVFLITLSYTICITPRSRNNIIYMCTHTSSYRVRFWMNVTFHNIFSFHQSQSFYIWNFKCVFETISTK